MEWYNLSMLERSELMKLYLKNGITSLSAMKEHYNSYQDGGKLTFQQWKTKMQQKYPDIEMDNNKAGYNYEEYFNNHYDEAIRQLSNLQHFPDTYKLPNHPTFSNESIYSRGPVMGGSWINDSTFIPSVINRQYYPNIYKEDRNYTEREIYNNRFDIGGSLEVKTDWPPKRVRRNDSPTQRHSEEMENRTARHIRNYQSEKINHNYDIPYIAEKEIIVPGVGRVSTNALDSIAKYSYMARIPLEEGLGLAAQETAFGAVPFLNYNEIPDSLSQEEKDKRAAANRALGNTSYFRNYGSIPANYLVRDWHYFDLADKQRANTPPLLDAFKYWKAGKYNTNDKGHTTDVKTKGKQVINTKPIQDWMRESKFVKKSKVKKK